MKETKELLKELISLPGLSGYEESVREVIRKAWEPLTDEISLSPIGNLYGKLHGDENSDHTVLIATHMDAIGLMVVNVFEGFLTIEMVGGVDSRVLPGQQVLVHTSSGDLPGVVITPPAHTLPEDLKEAKVLPLHKLLVDVGLAPEKVIEKVKPGDLISFNTAPMEMGDDYLSGHTMDNRSSVAALTEALRILQKRKFTWNVIATATVQEEVGVKGAITSGYEKMPEIGIVVDVTFGKGPGSNSYETFELGKGPTLVWGPNCHPGLYKVMKEIADDIDIPLTREVTPAMSGTDAMGMQVAGAGIPMIVIGLPLRYMHTPVEMVNMKDISRIARLIAEFITRLDEKMLEDAAFDKEEVEEEEKLEKGEEK